MNAEKKGAYLCLAPFHLEVAVVPLCLNLSAPSGNIIHKLELNMLQKEYYNGSINELVYLGKSFGLNLIGPEKRRVIFQVYLLLGGKMLVSHLILTLSSGESSAEVDTESEDMAEGGLAWADRSDREVDELVKDDKQQKEILGLSRV